MLAKVMSCATVGLEGVIVEVEVDISAGLPSLVSHACRRMMVVNNKPI